MGGETPRIYFREEPFDNAVFGFNKEQENELEVLLEEIFAEYDALVQKLAPKKQEPIQEFGGEIDVRKSKDEEVEFEMELLSTHLKLEVNYAGKVEGLKGYQTRIEVKKDGYEIVEWRSADIGDEIVEEEE
ncbi:hypothetical protein F8M41_008160 [Gigaspora margarita]|uniref:Uncharacterized protein n=1 Tax=Gigaspora margarita TaxID=4874 RepID=A0A8H3X3W0_GIGMA|nr:hypothetical protein F8M41_008160 [Gigaspora margarita]